MLKASSKILVGLSAAVLLAACGHDEPKTDSSHSVKQEKPNNKTDSKNIAKANYQNTAADQNSAESDGSMTVIANPSSILALVNKTHKLPDGYTPENLVYPNVPYPYEEKIEKRELRQDAATALEKLFAAAKEAGYNLYGESGYRSYQRQVSVYQHNVDTLGKEKADAVSAYPGTSEHQTGLSIDITSDDMLSSADPLTADFGNTEAGKWVAENAHKYGFIIRYPKGKEAITGYEYEPWHIRYVGVKAATYIYKHDLTLEQYINAEKVNGKTSSGKASKK
ncbi:MAG: M15 family metallopeptidase [Tuberibacillus sp.]